MYLFLFLIEIIMMIKMIGEAKINIPIIVPIMSDKTKLL